MKPGSISKQKKWKLRKPGKWNKWKHPSLSRRHISPLIVPHCHRGRSVQKARQRKYIIKRQARKKQPSEKAPQSLTLAPFSPILPPPSDLAGLTMRPTILPNEACLTDVGTISSKLDTEMLHCCLAFCHVLFSSSSAVVFLFQRF